MMVEKTESGRSMVRYLLNEMTEPERMSFEERYLNDSGLFHELVELETDLIDLYALDELTPKDRERLERSFLTDPARRQRLALAQSFESYSAPGADLAREKTNLGTWKLAWSMRFVAAALVLVALPIISWFLVTNHRLNNEVATLQRAQADALLRAQTLQRQIEELNQKLEEASVGQAQVYPQNQVVASFTLQSDLVRGNGEAPKLTIPSAATTVRLNLIFPADSFSNYDLTLETADGRQVWAQTGVKGHAAAGGSEQISATIPLYVLKNGDYVLQVTAQNPPKIEDVAAYSFQLRHRN